MPDKNENSNKIKCSFCGKEQEQVRRIVAGPGVCICDECIELCQEIIEEDFIEVNDVEPQDIPKPKEIKTILDEFVIGQEMAKKSMATTKRPEISYPNGNITS